MLVFNFLCLLHVSNLVRSSSGRQLYMQYGMFCIHWCEQSGGQETLSFSVNIKWWVSQTQQTLKNKRPTWCHLLFYFTSYVLSMFRTLIYPSSGACDYSVELPHWSHFSSFDVCWRFSVVGLEWSGWSLQHGYHPNPTTPKLQHTSNQEQCD